jgi:hypothetical protein
VIAPAPEYTDESPRFIPTELSERRTDLTSKDMQSLMTAE